MNEEAWRETLRTRRAVYFSRSRKKLWRKGEESGNTQIVKEIFLDCEPTDTILLKVEQIGGAACHEGFKTCFFRKIDASQLTVVCERVFDPKMVYKKDKENENAHAQRRLSSSRDSPDCGCEG